MWGVVTPLHMHNAGRCAVSTVAEALAVACPCLPQLTTTLRRQQHTASALQEPLCLQQAAGASAGTRQAHLP